MIELKNKIIAEIKKIYDPEIPVNIYELGLIYKIEISDEKKVNIEIEEKIIGSIAPKPYAKYFKGILEVSFEFFCLKDPPAAFLGFENFCSIFLKSFLLMKISLLISSNFGTFAPLIFVGILVIVFRFSKISSPIIPSPLERPLVKIPFS